MRKILIVGFGVTGRAFYDIVKGEGEISLYDDQAVDGPADLHPYDPEVLYDLALVTPGIKPSHPVIQSLRERSIHQMGEMDFVEERLKGRVLGITGTNGKTTTTHLLWEMLKAHHERSFLAGNVGIPLLRYLPESRDEDLFVTELSSFQLAAIHRFHPWIGAITNLREDHLNWHGSMEHYEESKFQLLRASDLTVINSGDAFLLERLKAHGIEIEKAYRFHSREPLEKGCWQEEGRIFCHLKEKEWIMDRADLRLEGEHNLENALCAILMARLADVPIPVIRKVLEEFRGLRHRYELLGEKDGIRYINDSKATNPDSAIPAIQSARRPTILLAGGMDKGSDFRGFFAAFTDSIQVLILYGETAEKMKKQAEEAGVQRIMLAEDLREAFHLAQELAEPGYDILLSPACASWDMYKNFEERGDHFRRLLGDLS